jgi:hypothetical protein
MPRNRSSLLILFSAVSLAFSLPAAVGDPQAIAALTKAFVAMNGSASFLDATLIGKARRIAGSDDETGAATIKVTSAGDSRMDLSLPSGPRGEIQLTATDPLNPAGSWSGRDSSRHAVASHNLYTDSSWFFPAFVVGRMLASQDFVVSHVGQESRNGQSLIHVATSRRFPDPSPRVAALLQHLSRMEVYLDSATLLPVALAFNTHPDNDAGRDIPVEIRFSDYRLESGIRVPFHVQKFVNNGLVLDLQFESAAFNTGLSASDFEAH